MNILLIIRSEILGILMLLFLMIYNFVCAKYREGKDRFFPFAFMALGHVVMGLITEISVNSPAIPSTLNDILHVLFFTFALGFSMQYLSYTLSLVIPEGKHTWYMSVAGILCVISIIIMLLSPIEYLQGNGTKYSAGTGPTLCYMLGFIYFTLSDVILLINYKKISRAVLLSLLPLSVIGLALMAIQIVVPEFLFTGAALTLMSLGAFFAIENPVGKFEDRAFIDINTGVWNRMAFEYDTKHAIKKKLDDGEKMYYVMSDLDGLKKTNDTYGHLEGDKLIRRGVRLLNDSLKSSYRIYRLGGDEFVALYFNKDPELIQAEINSVALNAPAYQKDLKIPISVSIGYAEHTPEETIDDTSKRADDAMYAMKAKHHGVTRED